MRPAALDRPDLSDPGLAGSACATCVLILEHADIAGARAYDSSNRRDRISPHRMTERQCGAPSVARAHGQRSRRRPCSAVSTARLGRTLRPASSAGYDGRTATARPRLRCGSGLEMADVIVVRGPRGLDLRTLRDACPCLALCVSACTPAASSSSPDAGFAAQSASDVPCGARLIAATQSDGFWP